MTPLALNARLVECGLELEADALTPLGTFRDPGRRTRPEYALARSLVAELGGPGSGLVIVVPKGYVTDGYSMPGRLLQAFQPRASRWLVPAIVHDWLYDAGLVGRRVCDAILLDVMRSMGVPEWQAKAVYGAVRAGGWGGFNKPLPINLKLVREARKASLSPGFTAYLKEKHHV